MTIVAAGQITIVDNNDARALSPILISAPGTQQTFTKDESSTAYSPDWTTANSSTGLLLTAKVYLPGVGSSSDIVGQLTNRRWTIDLINPITGTAALVSSDARMAAAFVSGAGLTFTAVHNGAGSTLAIKSNLLDNLAQVVMWFEGDYTDPVTSLVSRVAVSTTLGLVKTGTNAVYVQLTGGTVIEKATGATKNVIAVQANLMRQAGVDTTGITYRWFENNGSTQIVTGAPWNTEYGLKTTTAMTVPTAAGGDIGVNLPAAAAWSAHNTLVVSESAILNSDVLRVEVRDADLTVYQRTFPIYDISDPYTGIVNSTAGDKFQNGVGTTDLTVSMFYGGVPIASLTGWTFYWEFWNRAGKRGAFIDTTRTAQAGGRNVTVNTTGVSAVITYDGANITVAAGDIIKVVYPGLSERFYEVASGTANTITIRTPSTNTFLNYTNWPAPAVANDAVGAKLFICKAASVTTAAAAALTVIGDEIDAKGAIKFSADRP